MNAKPVSIVMVEDDEGHARLIERNIRRAGVSNEIVAFKDGTSALAAQDAGMEVLLGALVLHRLENGKDEISRALPDWLRHELPDFLTRPGDKELFADLVGVPSAGQLGESSGVTTS